MTLRHAVIVTGAAVLVLFAVTGGAARAACDLPPLAGDWVRLDPVEDQDLTRVEIIHRCTPNQYQGYAVLPGHTWTVRAFAKCRPRDCKWGRVPGHPDRSGGLAAEFQTFIAQRQLRIEPAGDAIRVEVFIDYHSDTRKNVQEHITFVREQ